MAIRIGLYVVALAALTSVGAVTVWQHMRAVRAGYRLGALEKERQALREQERKLELLRLEESALEALERRARELDLPIPGEDPLVRQLAR
jgi:hypothetical protein